MYLKFWLNSWHATWQSDATVLRPLSTVPLREHPGKGLAAFPFLMSRKPRIATDFDVLQEQVCACATLPSRTACKMRLCEVCI